MDTGSTSTGPDGFLNLHFLVLVGLVFPQEVLVASYDSVSSFFTRSASSFLILTVPLVVVKLSVFCCLWVHASFAKLQEENSKISGHTTVIGSSKIKRSQISISECVERINNEFEIQLFLTALPIQIVLLEKLDRVIFLMVSSNDFGDKKNCSYLVFLFLGYIGVTTLGKLLKKWEPLYSRTFVRTEFFTIVSQSYSETMCDNDRYYDVIFMENCSFRL